MTVPRPVVRDVVDVRSVCVHGALRDAVAGALHPTREVGNGSVNQPATHEDHGELDPAAVVSSRLRVVWLVPDEERAPHEFRITERRVPAEHGFA